MLSQTAMKLAILLSMLLALPTVAGADVLNPPGGPVYVDDDGQADAQPDRAQPGPRQQRGMKGMKAKKLRRALLEQFDVNGDGRLGPRERMRAVRVLRRIERRLANGPGGPGAQRGMRRGQMKRFIERHDRNGDGDLGPGEVPRGAQRRLRRLDRNNDGWVEENELGN